MKGFRQSARRITKLPRKAESKKHRRGGIEQRENRVSEGLRLATSSKVFFTTTARQITGTSRPVVRHDFTSAAFLILNRQRQNAAQISPRFLSVAETITRRRSKGGQCAPFREVASGTTRRSKGGNRKPSYLAGLDPLTLTRISAAAAAIRASYAAKIDSTRQDKSLTEDQRAAAIKELKQRGAEEVKAVKKRIAEEDKQTAKARRFLSPFTMNSAERLSIVGAKQAANMISFATQTAGVSRNHFLTHRR